MSDPLNSIVYIDEVHIENGNENSRKRSLPDEFEEYSGDDSVGNSYIKVKINVSSLNYSFNPLT